MGNGKFVMSILRFIFFFLDSVVFWGVEKLYELFLQLSKTTIFTRDVITEIGDKIFTLLGIFMIFKVSFSLIMYVINPDDIAKEGKGVSAILKNIIVSLILLVTVPYIFQAAMDLQIIVLKENVIGNLVLDSNQSFSETDMDYAGKKMSFTVFTAFFRPNEELVGTACDNLIDYASSGTDSLALDSGCLSALNGLNSTLGSIYSTAFNQLDINALATWDFASTVMEAGTDEEVYLFSYRFGFSTACGVVVLFLLLGFCFDVAIRSIKLGFYEIIAPIPIISYSDPKSGSNGIFKKWVKHCTSTYLSLFVRLLTIYLAVFLITILEGKVYNVVSGEQETGLLINVFVIMGVLMFARQLPKLLEDLIPGLKLEGSMGLNSAKGGLGALGTLGIGAIGGAVGGAVGGFARSGILGGLGGFLGGAVGGTVGGAGRAVSGLAAGKKSSDMMRGQANANMARFQRNLYGVNGLGLAGARMNNMFGIPGAAGAGDARIKALEQKMKPLKTQSDVYKKVGGYKSAINDVAKKEFMKSSEYASANANLDYLKNTQIRQSDFKDKAGNADLSRYKQAVQDHKNAIANAYGSLAAEEKRFVEDYVNKAFKNSQFDAEISGLKSQLDSTLSANSSLSGISGKVVESYSDLKNIADSVAAASSGLELQINGIQDEINKISNSTQQARTAASMVKK